MAAHKILDDLLRFAALPRAVEELGDESAVLTVIRLAHGVQHAGRDMLRGDLQSPANMMRGQFLDVPFAALAQRQVAANAAGDEDMLHPAIFRAARIRRNSGP